MSQEADEVAAREMALSDQAEAAGDMEARDRHWRNAVVALWKPMSDRVPWDPAAKNAKATGNEEARAVAS